MALTNEDLLAISQLLDVKLKPMDKKIDSRTQKIEFLLENNVLPRLQNIEACYTSTYRRYSEGMEQLEKMQLDMDILKKVVSGHSEKLQKLA